MVPDKGTNKEWGHYYSDNSAWEVLFMQSANDLTNT